VNGIYLLTIQSAWMILMVKTLMVKLHVRVADFLFVLLLGIGGGLVYSRIGFFISPLMVLALFYYVYKVNRYEIEKSIFLSTTAMLLAILADHTTSFIIDLILNETALTNASLLSFHIFLSIVIGVLFTLLFVSTTKKIRARINQDKRLQILLASVTSFILFTFYGTIILSMYLESSIEHVRINLTFFLLYLFAGFIIFYFYAKVLREMHVIKRRKEEQERLKQYTDSIEAQYHEMRKFKHDYQNVLLSIGTFIQENDLEGVRDYYLNGIKAQSQRLLDDSCLIESGQTYKREGQM